MSQITTEKLKETIKLVEARVRTSTDEESLRELLFLAEHYTAVGEWDKASAATRHLIAVADGKPSRFEVLPSDVEFQRSRKSWLKARYRKALGLVVLFELIFLSFLSVSQWIPPELIANLRCAVMPWDSNAYVNRAEVRFSKGNFREALADANAAERLSPGNQQAVGAVGWISYRLGDFSAADSAQARMNHSKASCWRLKAALDSHRNLPQDAATDWELASALSGCFEDSLRAADNFRRAGDFSRALPLSNVALCRAKCDADRAAALITKSQILKHLNQDEEALASIDNSLALGRGNTLAQVIRAELLYKTGRYSEAVAAVSVAINRDPQYVHAYQIRAASLEAAGRAADAAVDRSAINRLGGLTIFDPCSD